VFGNYDSSNVELNTCIGIYQQSLERGDRPYDLQEIEGIKNDKRQQDRDDYDNFLSP